MTERGIRIFNSRPIYNLKELKQIAKIRACLKGFSLPYSWHVKIFHLVCRVFWKSRQLYSRKPTYDLDYEVPLTLRRRPFKRKRKRPSKDSGKHDEQVYNEMITLPCSICKHEIDLPRIFPHKKQHVALATLGFQQTSGKKPALSVIAFQRQFIIAKLLSSFGLTEKILQSINNAFELLWKKQIPAYYKIIHNIRKSSVYP